MWVCGLMALGQRLETLQGGWEQLRDGRVDMHRQRDHRIRSLGVHGCKQNMHDLIAADAQDSGPQNFLAVRVHENFDKAVLDNTPKITMLDVSSNKVKPRWRFFLWKHVCLKIEQGI